MHETMKKKKDEVKATSSTSDASTGDVGKITAEAFEKMTKSGIADVASSSWVELGSASSKSSGVFTGAWIPGTGWYTEHPEYTTPSWETPSWTSWGVSGGEREDPGYCEDSGDPVPVETEKSAPTIPAYADGFMPHLVRAKEEGLRKGIEMDTVVIDRGVAVSCGLGHVDMVLGLKVKYAKEGVLPMDSAFVIYKEKDGKKDSRRGVFERGAAGEMGGNRFLSIPMDNGGRSLLAIDRVVSIVDKWKKLGPKKEDPVVWSDLELIYDDCGERAEVRFSNKKDAAYVRDQIGLETPEDAKPEEE